MSNVKNKRTENTTIKKDSPIPGTALELKLGCQVLLEGQYDIAKRERRRRRKQPKKESEILQTK